MRFIKFLSTWVSKNLAIPLWVIGHIHIMLSSYLAVENLFASLGMNLIVVIKFWLDWREHKAPKIDHMPTLTKMILENERKVNDTSSKVHRIIKEINQMKVYK